MHFAASGTEALDRLAEDSARPDRHSLGHQHGVHEWAGIALNPNALILFILKPPFGFGVYWCPAMSDRQVRSDRPSPVKGASLVSGENSNEAAGGVFVVSPAAKRRPERKSSRCFGLRK